MMLNVRELVARGAVFEAFGQDVTFIAVLDEGESRRLYTRYAGETYAPHILSHEAARRDPAPAKPSWSRSLYRDVQMSTSGESQPVTK